MTKAKNLSETNVIELLKATANEHGFSLAKVTSPDFKPEIKKRLVEFLENEFHGQMSWLEKRVGTHIITRCTSSSSPILFPQH